jgi:protein gp37
MAENTKIEWAHHTVNFWWGCTKVSPACQNCYAEAQDRHFHPGPYEKAEASHWGDSAPRMLRVEAARKEAFKYQRRAEKEGVRFRVFTNSMSDFFEDRRDLDLARLDALDIMAQTPNLDWLVLTKRPERIMDLLKRASAMAVRTSGLAEFLRAWTGEWNCDPLPPANVWLGTTVENQEWADKRIPEILRVPASVRFLSCEPMLGPINISRYLPRTPEKQKGTEWDAFGIDWTICGGESGARARPMDVRWALSLRDQCAAAGVPFLFKQWGEWLPDNQNPRIPGPSGASQAIRVGKARAGRLLDGMLHDGYPKVNHD